MAKSRHTSEQGFTLLELLMVVAVLALVTSLATEYVVGKSNQARANATKERLQAIRYAIIGDASRTLNNQPAFSGFIADTGEVPKYLRDLLSNRYCTSSLFRKRNRCEKAGFEWRELHNWKGPYLQASGYKTITGQQSSAEIKVPLYRDGWGNHQQGIQDTLNFGWDYKAKADDNIRIASLGLNGSAQDDPQSGKYIYEKDRVSNIGFEQIRGGDIPLNIVNHSGLPDSRFCIQASYRNGDTTVMDLAAGSQLPGAGVFGEVVLSGLKKASGSTSCKAAKTYSGIAPTRYFSHNLFYSGQLELAIQ